MSDGTTVRYRALVRDHKRLEDGDRGPNTDGMGAYSPVAEITPALRSDILARIVQPTVDELRRRGTPYVGFLDVGAMLTADGPAIRN